MPIFKPPEVAELKAKQDVGGLVKALGYLKVSNVRMEAAQALGELGGVEAVEPLMAALQDPDMLVRRAAAKALGQIGDDRATQALITSMNSDGQMSVRHDAVGALTKIGDPRAVVPLIAVIQDELQFDVRWYAIVALGRLGDARAVEPLVAALNGEDATIRRYAAAALANINTQPAIQALVAALGAVELFEVEYVTAALVEIGPRAVEPLASVLASEGDWMFRYRAATALGSIGDEAAEEALAIALEDSDESVRGAAEEALLGIWLQRDAEAEKHLKKQRMALLLQDLPVIAKDNLEAARRRLVNLAGSPHPRMFSGSRQEALEFIALMVEATRSFILSCQGIKDVHDAFLISASPARSVLEIQYEQLWDDNTSNIYSEHVARTGVDEYEVFGSRKSAARMERIWSEAKSLPS